MLRVRLFSSLVALALTTIALAAPAKDEYELAIANGRIIDQQVHSLTLAWDPTQGGGIMNFVITRADLGYPLAELPPTTTTYTDSDLAPGSAYTYTVYENYPGYNPQYSVEIEGTTLLPTATPTASQTPTHTPTSTPTRTPTATPTRTPTRTATSTFTPTRTATSTPTATRTWTFTPTFTVTATPTPFPDIDGDGIADGLEGFPAAAGQPNRYLRDSDGDGLIDGTEDADRNGVLDGGETDTRNLDSDADGFWDGIELLLGHNPLLFTPGFVDSDGDGWPDAHDPNNSNPDSDGDRFKDGYEAGLLGSPAVTDAGQVPRLGDVDGNGTVGNLDALAIQSLFLTLVQPTHPFFGGDGFIWSDSNRDGQITNLDALVVTMFFVQLLNHLPLGP